MPDTALPNSPLPNSPLQGLHHISLIARDAQRTLDFYTRTLGLNLVKQTVNYDDPTSYHLYFGDATGTPGSIVTFFIVENAKAGRSGIGGTHHFALEVADGAALRKWKRYLSDQKIVVNDLLLKDYNIIVNGPLDRHYFESIYFKDPDGTVIEIATTGPGWTVDEAADALGSEHRDPPAEMLTHNRNRDAINADTHPEPVPAITPDMKLTRRLHHITAISSDIERTHAYFGELLGMRLIKRTHNLERNVIKKPMDRLAELFGASPLRDSNDFDASDSQHWHWGVGDGAPGTVLTYFERDPKREANAKYGAGQTHHFALSVPDEETQGTLRERLLQAGYRVSPVMDRTYFKSIYSSDPDGHVVEIATAGPGFGVDEERLGANFQLPAWLESQRDKIETNLPPLTLPESE